MKIHKTAISQCFWTEPQKHCDDRGMFSEIFKYNDNMIPFKSVQSNYSFSKTGTLRGVHRTPYAKYVTCVRGEIYDVCVDLRPESKTYQKHFSILLNENILNGLYIPPYCGHVFLAMVDSIIIYQQSDQYNSALNEIYCYKNYNINWPIEILHISEQDSKVCLL